MVLSFETTTSQPVNLSLTVENLFLLSFHSQPAAIKQVFLRLPLKVSESLHLTVSFLLGLGHFPLVLSLKLWAFLLSRSRYRCQAFHQVFALMSRLSLPLGNRILEQFHTTSENTQRLGLQTHVCRRLPQFHVLNWIDKLMWSRNGLLVCVLQELHILFVPLLHALQYHLALVSLQLQSLDLNDDTINFKDKKIKK